MQVKPPPIYSNLSSDGHNIEQVWEDTLYEYHTIRQSFTSNAYSAASPPNRLPTMHYISGAHVEYFTGALPHDLTDTRKLHLLTCL